MSSNVKSAKEKLIWIVATVSAALLLIGSIAYISLSASGLNAELASVQNQEQKISDSVDQVEQTQFAIDECKSALSAVDEAYDNYWSAYIGWTDEVEVMLNYGIFAADTVALIAIPQIAADGDDALSAAMNQNCG